MATEVLMQFLKIGLIDLQGSDEKLEKLEATSIALEGILQDQPKKTLSYTLLALDSKAPEDDPVTMEVISILEENWTTYFNTFSGTPIQVVRALLLQALVNASDKNQEIAIAFLSIAQNALPHTKVGKEKSMWAEITDKIERELNTKAESEWSTPDKISVRKFSYKPPKDFSIASKDVSVSRVTLKRRIATATGPQNEEGEKMEGNQYWPNSATQWVYAFNTHMTNAIAETINTAFAQAKIDPVDLAQPLKDLSVAVATHINSTLDAVSTATIGLQRRTSLIWWKESLYSTSASCSYRIIPINTAVAVMAFDLFKQVPICSPASVTAFLAESVLTLFNNKTEKKVGLKQRINEMQQSQYTVALREYINDRFNGTEGRGPLLKLLISNLSPDEQQFQILTGFTDDTLVSNSEWATWVFRELQAIRAVTEA